MEDFKYEGKGYGVGRLIGMFFICLLASITVCIIAHELVHVAQFSLDPRVEPVSISIDFGKESAAHVSYVFTSKNIDDIRDFEQQSASREFVAYFIGFVTLILFMYMLLNKRYFEI